MNGNKSIRRIFCVWFHVSYSKKTGKPETNHSDASCKGKTRVFVFRANAPLAAVEKCTRTKRRSGFFPDEFVPSPFYHVFSARTRINPIHAYTAPEGLST